MNGGRGSYWLYLTVNEQYVIQEASPHQQKLKTGLLLKGQLTTTDDE